MGILIHCDTLDNLDYCYEQFMTILLTLCSLEAHDCIVNITNAHSKQQTYDSNEFDINSDVENNDLFEQNYKLEGRVFIDSPFFKR